MHLVWDIEGNGLHEITIDQNGQPTKEADKVHCNVAISRRRRCTAAFISFGSMPSGKGVIAKAIMWSP